MAKIGYARVSTGAQDLERQILALEAEGCDVIYQEKITGTKIDRPELQKLLTELREGDMVIVKELTRVSCFTRDMLDLVTSITNRGASIKSLNEPWLDTGNAAGKLMMTIFAGLAQFERDLMQERCEDGRRVAKKNGVTFGRPKREDDRLKYALSLYNKGEMSLREICSATGVPKATLCRRIAENKRLEVINTAE